MRKLITLRYFRLRSITPKLFVFGMALIFGLSAMAHSSGNSLNEFVNVQQKRTITGNVSDAKTGEVLPGVNVTIKGTTFGTVTDFDGNYSLDVEDASATLVFSFIGYTPQEIVVGNQTMINVSLAMDTEDLEEVVVVAYGTQKKSNLTGSVASVNSEDLKKTNTAPNITERLKGRAAGVQVISNTNGKPGEAATVKIRGASTLAGNTHPLWVVDGMLFTSAPNLNPDDIEDMSILKDASSTAMYGSRAAAGVIVVTTKKGTKGKSEINFSYKKGISTRDMGNFKVMNSQQLYDHFTTFWSPEYHAKYTELETNLRDADPNMSDEDIEAFILKIIGTEDAFINKGIKGKFTQLDTCTQLLNVDTKWEDFAFRTGQVDEYNINYTGGGEKYSVFFSGGLYNEKGILQGQDYKRYTGNVNLNYKPVDRLNIDTRINTSYSDRFEQDGGALYNTFIYMPWDTAYNADGTIREILDGASADGRKWYGRDESNYLYPRQYNYSTSNSLNNRIRVAATLKITDDISIEHANNLNFGNGNSFSNADIRTSSGRQDDRNGAIFETSSKSVKYLTNTFLRFNKTLGDHTFKMLVGYEYEKYNYSYTSASGTGVIPGVEIMAGTAKAEPNKGAQANRQNQSVLSNFNYILKDKYLFQASLRFDGSSQFHPGKQYGTFYTVSAGWVVSKEDFLKNNWIVNFLKLRSSIGTVGNQYSNGDPAKSFGYYQAFGVYGFDVSYNDIPGLFPKRPNLLPLTWETKADFNVAADFRLFDRIGGTIEFYNSKAINLYGWKKLSTLTGFDEKLVNFGGIANRGLEISLNPTLINQSDLRWDMNFNISFNHNEVTQIDDAGRDMLDRGTMIWKIGEDSKTFYMREWAGVDTETGEPLWRYERKNADGSITDTVTSNWNNAQKFVQDETGSPKFFGGFGTTVQYKDFTLSAIFNYSYGNYIYYSGMSFFDNDGAYAQYNQAVHGEDYVRWEKPGDIATHPKAVYGGNKLSHNTSNRYLYDGSYLKLGNISFSYRLHDKAIIEKIGVKEMTFTATADNVFTLSKFPGVNPEVDSWAGNDVSPIIRKFMLGVNLKF